MPLSREEVAATYKVSIGELAEADRLAELVRQKVKRPGPVAKPATRTAPALKIASSGARVSTLRRGVRKKG